MAKGYIYIFTNPLYKDIKIGYSKNVQKRLHDLSTAVPKDYCCYAIYEVDGDSSLLQDKKLHNLIDSLNPDLRSVEIKSGKVVKKEFYNISKEQGYYLLECIAKITGTEDKLHYTDDFGNVITGPVGGGTVAKLSKLKFSALGINPGDELVYTKDASVTVKVLSDGYVEYQGNPIALSPLATKLLGYKHGVQGTAYFSFKGEILVDMRKRLGV